MEELKEQIYGGIVPVLMKAKSRQEAMLLIRQILRAIEEVKEEINNLCVD